MAVMKFSASLGSVEWPTRIVVQCLIATSDISIKSCQHHKRVGSFTQWVTNVEVVKKVEWYRDNDDRHGGVTQ